MMFLNIITPCSRPQNLHEIFLSINIPRENYRWLVIFDFKENEIDKKLIPHNAEIFFHQNKNSLVGHDQRNRALKEIKYKSYEQRSNFGHIYSNDDDALIHKDLWENISTLEDYDIISFKQRNPDLSHRLRSEKLSVGYVDSHNFIYSTRLIEKLNVSFDCTTYEADGIFAKKLVNSTDNHIFINKYLSIYNELRNDSTNHYSDKLE